MAVGDLTTLATLKEWLNIPSSTTTSDALLSRMISACSNYIQTFMSRTIAVAGYTETRNGMGSCRMMLKNTPVVSVESLSIDGLAIPVRPTLGPNSSTLPWGYVFDDQILYLSGYVFNRGAQNVAVSYHAGFATTPPDIEQACIDMIGDWFKYKDRIGKLSEGIEQQTITFTNADIPARSKGVLLAYKRVSPVY